MKWKTTNHGPLCLWAAFTITAMTQGAELFTDAFDYEDGPLVGAFDSVWQTHSQAGNGPVLVHSGRLELRADQFEDINAPLPDGPYTVDGAVTVLYAQFALEAEELPTESGAYFAHLRSGNTHRARVWASTLNAAPGFFRLGIGNSSEADAQSGQIAMDLETNRSYRVVMRYDISTGLSSVGIDPQGESDLTVTAADPVGLSSISSFAFRQAGDMGALWIDDLVVSDGFPGQSEFRLRLEVSRAGADLIFRWPGQATNHVLQSTISLNPPDWSDEETAPIPDGSWLTHRMTPPAGSRFYRLRQR